MSTLIKILNPEDIAFCNKTFRVRLGYHLSLDALIVADNESDVVDYIIDSFEKTESENPGYFLSEEEIEELGESTEDYISGGNHGRILSFTNAELHIQQVNNAFDLYVEID